MCPLSTCNRHLTSVWLLCRHQKQRKSTNIYFWANQPASMQENYEWNNQLVSDSATRYHPRPVQLNSHLKLILSLSSLTYEPLETIFKQYALQDLEHNTNSFVILSCHLVLPSGLLLKYLSKTVWPLRVWSLPKGAWPYRIGKRTLEDNVSKTG